MVIERMEILHEPRGFAIACGQCQRNYAAGRVAIRVFVRGRTEIFLLGEDRQIQCCGQMKRKIRFFSDPRLASIILERLTRHSSPCEGSELPLIQWTGPSLAT